jgi:hypothetical protein
MRQQLPNWPFVTCHAAANLETARKAFNDLLVDSPEMLVQTAPEYLDAQSSANAQFLLMVQMLLGLAILIAVLGVVNTLALSVLERHAGTRAAARDRLSRMGHDAHDHRRSLWSSRSSGHCSGSPSGSASAPPWCAGFATRA